ncbi:Hypothetical Protein NTJ_01469 [Nesidiocoris tenuis]|uniref:DNA topoisomerase (ATP-hydrolyzing) n=1 Tax=Nesidiocoris tenuis TaxID=355587 RepID=A0ABN7A8N1_9HEMI|nr:Hypothetical Protein NTJ_01469 [Nesidiocoris tenuis]
MSWDEVAHAVSILQVNLLERSILSNDRNVESTVESSEIRKNEIMTSLRELFYGLKDSRDRNEVLHIHYGENQRMTCMPHDSGIGYYVALIVEKMYLNVLTKTYSTRRSIYYERPEIFKTQAAVDSAVNRVCHILDLPQWELGILSTSKGLIYGPLIIRLASGLEIDCTGQNGGTLIPQDLSNGAELETGANFALVVEKDTVFQKLLHTELGQPQSRCILVTGKGYPDLNTRLLVRKITTELMLPTFAIVDGDPHGVEIFFNYKYGSMSQHHLNRVLAAPDIFWLGVHPSDMINLPEDQLIPQNPSDVAKIKTFFQRKYVIDCQPLHDQLSELFRCQRKCEIEALYHFSHKYLSDTYIPLKISSGQFL